jgi:tRNA modification GTPase
MTAARDTIFALSSGRPPAAIAVVRLSGPCAGAALETLVGRVPEPRKAALVRVRNPGSNEVIDEALALWFPGPNSETGEDVAELQLHGGRAVIAAVLNALGQIEGLRPAEPGEFTRRAFENGRLDLTAVEGLADLIYAETEAQRRQAYRQLKGLLGERAETWRQRLVEALALVEARIDFSDEADVPEDLLGPALAIARGLRDEIAQALAGAVRGERLRDGRSAQRRQVDTAQSHRAPRGGDRVAGGRHDARRDRGPPRPGGLSGDAARHRRHQRQQGSGRAGRGPACSFANIRS